jgi:transposase
LTPASRLSRARARSSLRGRRAAVVLALGLLTGCRFQDLTPGGTRRDETAAQTAVAVMYQAIGARSAPVLASASLPAATALIASDHGTVVLVPIRTMVDVPERRNQGGGVRIVRSDLHVDGEIASDRIVVVSRAADHHEFEATDVIALAHREGVWRVAQAAFGPWRSRTTP